MGNCLITTLKSVVNNNNLAKVGHVIIDVDINAGVQTPFLLQNAESFDCRIIGSGHFYKGAIDSQTNVSTELLGVTDTSGYRVSPGQYKVDISSKYSLTRFQCKLQINLGDFDYSPNCHFYGVIPKNITPEELKDTVFVTENRLEVSLEYFKPYGIKASEVALYSFIELSSNSYPTSFENVGVVCTNDVSSIEALTEIFAGTTDSRTRTLGFAGYTFTLNGVTLTMMSYIAKDGTVYKVKKNSDNSVLATYDPSQPVGSRWTYV